MKRIAGLFLTAALIIGTLPFTALAVDNEQVLTSVGHSSAVSAVTVTGYSATLTVPYGYTGTLDLSNGLDIHYNTSAYTSASAAFPSGAAATVGGDPVLMRVTYLKTSDTAAYTTDYSINVVRQAPIVPVFTGTIAKTLTLPSTLTGAIPFAAADFSSKYAKNDGADLASVVITGSNPSFGTLKLGTQNYSFGTAVPVSDLTQLSFAATATGTVSYVVKAYAAGDTTNLIGSVTLVITVSASNVAPVFTGTISKALTLPGTSTGTIAFTTADFSSKYTKNDGADLASVVITGSNPSFGTLKLGTQNYSFGTAVPASDLGQLTFAATAAGTVSYVVKAYASGDTTNLIGSVTLVITVSAPTGPDAISYSKEKNEAITFRAGDFASVCEKLTGKPLSYVLFTLPASTSGTLYYDYDSSSVITTPVLADTKYFNGANPTLSAVTFVPASGFLGTAALTYTGYDTAGTSYVGTIQITYQEEEQEQEHNGSKHFRDVGIDLSWATKAIDYLFEQGIISGVKPGYYNPNSSISRGDFTLMLCRAFHLSADAKGNFSDVEEDSYYSDAISTAKALGIAKGSNGKFNPHSALSRQDAMVLIARAMDAAGISLEKGSSLDLQKFTDSNKISDYAVDAFAALVKANIIQGYGETLSPHSNVSRAEMAIILYRALTM